MGIEPVLSVKSIPINLGSYRITSDCNTSLIFVRGIVPKTSHFQILIFISFHFGVCCSNIHYLTFYETKRYYQALEVYLQNTACKIRLLPTNIVSEVDARELSEYKVATDAKISNYEDPEV